MSKAKTIASTSDAQYKALLMKIEKLIRKLKMIDEDLEMLKKRIPRSTKATLAIVEAYKQGKESKHGDVTSTVTLKDLRASTQLLQDLKQEIEELVTMKQEVQNMLNTLVSKVQDMPLELTKELNSLSSGGSRSSRPSAPRPERAVA